MKFTLSWSLFLAKKQNMQNVNGFLFKNRTSQLRAFIDIHCKLNASEYQAVGTGR